MSAPSLPPDNSMQMRQMEIEQENRRRAEETQKAEARKQELAGLRSSAQSGARGSANQYFTQQGLDPNAYGSEIDDYINQTLNGVAPDDPNPGSYFNDIGQRVFDTAQSNFRNKNTRSLDNIFAPNFETTRIPFTLDDPYLDSINAENRSSADQVLRNMLDRGVITNTGYTAGVGDLDKQSAGVKARLNELGTGTLASGQQSLKDIANKGRQTASTLNLGQQFDPFAYSGEADQTFNDFIQNLGTNIRSKITGNLYNTSGLAAIAGASQGAQNLPFDPNAQNALDPEEDKKKEASKDTVF